MQTELGAVRSLWRYPVKSMMGEELTNEVRLQLSVLAYNLGNLWRRLVLPKRIDSWSLTSLQQRLVKTGGRRLGNERVMVDGKKYHVLKSLCVVSKALCQPRRKNTGVIPMKRRNLITLPILSCFIVALVGCNARPDLESERNLKTRHEEPGPSLLSFVDMHTYALVLCDLTTRTKAMIDLKTLPGWPGPAPEHTLLLPDGKKVLVTYMASATEPVGIAVIKINSINWVAGTADVQVVKNLETDKAGSRSTFPPVTQTSPDQYINKKVDDDWSRPVFAQLHGPTLLPHSRFAYFTMWTDDRIVAVDVEADKLLASQQFGNASNHLHGVYFNDSGTLGLGVGYFYDESNLSVFRPNRQTGALELLGEIHLGTANRYAPFIHNAFWLDERFAIAGTMQFGPTSLTPAQASIIGPSIWLVDTRTMKASKIIRTAKDVDDPGVLRSASWITVAGNKLLVAEEDSLDASYADDGFVRFRLL